MQREDREPNVYDYGYVGLSRLLSLERADQPGAGRRGYDYDAGGHRDPTALDRETHIARLNSLARPQG